MKNTHWVFEFYVTEYTQVMGHWIHAHEKFTLKSNFQHFTESHFTSVLCNELPFTPNSRNFSNFTWLHDEIDNCSLKITKNGVNCHSRISRFTQIVRSEITFKLHSHKFFSLVLTFMFRFSATFWIGCKLGWVFLFFSKFLEKRAFQNWGFMVYNSCTLHEMRHTGVQCMSVSRLTITLAGVCVV